MQNLTVSPASTATRSAVAVRGLRKSFGQQVVLDGIDLEVAEGTVFALLGPNGSGKPNTGFRHSFSLDASGWSVCLPWCLAGLGEDVEDGGGGRGGLGGPGLVPGGDVPSAERGQGADGYLSLPEG